MMAKILDYGKWFDVGVAEPPKDNEVYLHSGGMAVRSIGDYGPGDFKRPILTPCEDPLEWRVGEAMLEGVPEDILARVIDIRLPKKGELCWGCWGGSPAREHTASHDYARCCLRLILSEPEPEPEPEPMTDRDWLEEIIRAYNHGDLAPETICALRDHLKQTKSAAE